tara:strand:+ start:3949 stop:4188 length:240 start_codon:yes stop_codon:yes gene_type:complete
MKKTQRNPVVIDNVYHLAKVGVEGSNPFTRSKHPHKYASYFNELLCGFFAVTMCIIALAILICAIYAIHYCIITYMLAH